MMKIYQGIIELCLSARIVPDQLSDSLYQAEKKAFLMDVLIGAEER